MRLIYLGGEAWFLFSECVFFLRESRGCFSATAGRRIDSPRQRLPGLPIYA